jgi:hypothetical protein
VAERAAGAVAAPPAEGRGRLRGDLRAVRRELHHGPTMYAFHDHRNMVFVDGENFTIRGQEFARKRGIALEEGEYWAEDVFLWMPHTEGDFPRYAGGWGESGPARSERAYFYTSIPAGNSRARQKAALSLRKLNFEPKVFTKKKKNEPSKGVDVSLTTALVSHAYRDDFNVAFLVCGDGDYVPVVEEIKNAGRRVVVVFFNEANGLNTELRIAADRYIDIGDYFASSWESLDRARKARAAQTAAGARRAATT